MSGAVRWLSIRCTAAEYQPARLAASRNWSATNTTHCALLLRQGLSPTAQANVKSTRRLDRRFGSESLAAVRYRRGGAAGAGSDLWAGCPWRIFNQVRKWRRSAAVVELPSTSTSMCTTPHSRVMAANAAGQETPCSRWLQAGRPDLLHRLLGRGPRSVAPQRSMPRRLRIQHDRTPRADPRRGVYHRSNVPKSYVDRRKDQRRRPRRRGNISIELSATLRACDASLP